MEVGNRIEEEVSVELSPVAELCSGEGYKLEQSGAGKDERQVLVNCNHTLGQNDQHSHYYFLSLL